jgi:hypothetical protein
MEEIKFKEIPEPVGAFIMAQPSLTPLVTANGYYWHYKDVVTLLTRYAATQHPAGCEWVKCSDWLPGYKNSVKWRVSGSDVVRNATLEALLRDRNFYFKSWEWYDESPAPAAGREEEAVGLIKYIRENYKPSKEVWKDKFGIALLSDEGIFSMFIQQKEGKV